jgi:ABC-type multidrug transport system fused ATPase/permease subunit
MQEIQSIDILLTRLWRHITGRRRKQLGVLLVLMVLASFAEILSIGSVLPFLGMLTAPERVFSHPVAQPIILWFGITAPGQLLLPATIAFAIAALAAGAMRLLLLWATTRLSFATGADLSIEIYRRTLYQPYAVHVSRNSSEVIAGISAKANDVINSVLFPVLMIVSAGVMLVAILLALLSVNPRIALTAFGGFGAIYVVVVKLTRKQLAHNSEGIARESVQVIKSLQEGLGGIRDVLIDGTQSVYCTTYRAADLQLRRAQGSNQFLGNFPRFGIEALGMLLISALAYGMAREPGGMAVAIPVLGALALGAQRMLPILQQAYGSLTAMRAGQASLQDALSLLDQPLPDHADQPAPAPIPFSRGLSIDQLSFRYSADTPPVLRDLTLSIDKGSRVGFIGATGSGKSTLLDIVMGLLQPTEGTLAVDGVQITPSNLRSWQAHIAHVPQSIFLADTSIAENIAFGVSPEHIEMERVKDAASRAQIAQVIESWPQQYKTKVGERGVRLSGGQRQRIGIARALYKQADVIVFDEATSALDNETERAVMQAIESLGDNLTLFIIAHRLTTLKNCTCVVKLGAAGEVQVGSYESTIAQVA